LEFYVCVRIINRECYWTKCVVCQQWLHNASCYAMQLSFAQPVKFVNAGYQKAGISIRYYWPVL